MLQKGENMIFEILKWGMPKKKFENHWTIFYNSRKLNI